MLRSLFALRLAAPLGLAAALLAGCASAPVGVAPPAHAASARVVARPGPSLQQQLEAAMQGFRGDVGVYVKHLATGETAAVNADTVFPTASLVKVPLLVGTFEAMHQGRLAYDQPLVYRDSLTYGGSGIAQFFRDSTQIDVNTAVWLMMAMSDNVASLWLQRLVTGDSVNAWLARRGFADTRVNSRVPSREAARTRYGWGQTTPRELARLVALIRQGRAVSPAADAEMYRTMTRAYWNDGALAALPPWVQAASKQGMISQTRGEVVLVNAPHGDYVLCIITKNQQDQRWTDDNEGDVLLKRLAGIVWNRFEPGSDWTAPTGAF